MFAPGDDATIRGRSVEECPSEDVVLAFIEGRLPAPKAASLHDHIDRCAPCEALFVELARATEAPPEPTPSAVEGDERATQRRAGPAPELPRELVFAPGVIVGGRYRLERLLGEGGMGIVWAATHTVTRRPFALKLLKAVAGDVSNHTRRLFREARAASAVDHPNIVRVLDVFEQDGTPVLVMDLLEGEPLGRRLQRRGPLRLDEVAAIMTPVLSAVAAAHAAGVVHRDLKPDNIFLVGAEGDAVDVRVLDFGVAKMTVFEDQAAESRTLTRTGEVVGTPHYMAPEQFFGEHDIDSRADVWALGVVLYECLAGRRPFSGDSLGQVLKSVTSGEHTPLRQAAPHVPPEFARLVERMLQRERGARPAELRTVAKALQRAAGSPARPAGATQAAPSGARRRTILLRWGATASLSAAAAAGVWAAPKRWPTEASRAAPAAAPSTPAIAAAAAPAVSAS
nr:serine/threonine protein kinase [Polyangiaceae bacterium]